MLRILGKHQSINVRKVLWTCDEIGIDYAQENWGAGTRATSDAAFLNINPKGLVPVLIDDGAVLTESNTIMRYLAAKYHRDDLLPNVPLARARVEEIMDWQATEFNSAWRVAFQALVRRSQHAGSLAQIAQSVLEWTMMVRLLEQRLAHTGSHICGDCFTLADIVIGVSVNRWFQAPIDRPDLPKLRAYFERLLQRPAARRYLAGDTD